MLIIKITQISLNTTFSDNFPTAHHQSYTFSSKQQNLPHPFLWKHQQFFNVNSYNFVEHYVGIHVLVLLYECIIDGISGDLFML